MREAFANLESGPRKVQRVAPVVSSWLPGSQSVGIDSLTFFARIKLTCTKAAKMGRTSYFELISCSALINYPGTETFEVEHNRGHLESHHMCLSGGSQQLLNEKLTGRLR